jgi:hypothetical protein
MAPRAGLEPATQRLTAMQSDEVYTSKSLRSVLQAAKSLAFQVL